MANRHRAAATIAALILAGSCTSCGTSTTDGSALLDRKAPASVTITSRTLPGVGRVLTDSAGHALYLFPPDASSRVTCTGPCAGTWPALVIGSGEKPHVSAPLRAGLVGTLPDPNTGQRVVTYGGNPLYHYAGDVTRGTANGQGLFLDGGPWYLLNTRAQPVTSSPSPRVAGSGSGGGSSAGGS